MNQAARCGNLWWSMKEDALPGEMPQAGEAGRTEKDGDNVKTSPKSEEGEMCVGGVCFPFGKPGADESESQSALQPKHEDQPEDAAETKGD